MRIIDKQHDFYDYLQDPTDTIVFDRRDSFLLTKEMICNRLRFWRDKNVNRYILMQCGANFWLFLLTVTEFVNSTPKDYDLQLLDYWKNYDKPLLDTPISLTEIKFPYYLRLNNNQFRDAINHNEYESENNFNNFLSYRSNGTGWDAKEYTIPLLKACGVSNLVDPTIIFCAIEEYFSMKKTASETTEPKGITNDDKIIMHGFDTKTSFRGKKGGKYES